MRVFAKENIDDILHFLITFLLIVVLLPLLLLIGIGHLFYGIWLNFLFRSRWKPQNKHILFVYSESPNWQQYIEEKIVPVIRERAVFLNWSKRAEWRKRKPLEAKVLFRWGGEKDFNPMAIVFLPKGKIKTIRFHQAFKDFKHGNNTLLRKQESELYMYL